MHQRGNQGIHIDAIHGKSLDELIYRRVAGIAETTSHMLLRFSSLPDAFRALTAGVLVYSIFWWSVWAPGAAFDGIKCFAALRLAWCAIILSLLGHAVITLIARWLSQDSRSRSQNDVSPLARLPYISNAILALAVGQVVAMGWVFARSTLSGLTHLLIGRVVPITPLEVCVLLIGAGLIATRDRAPKVLLHSTVSLRRAVGALSFLGVLLCIATPLTVRELPRSVALSSDPDQHAFWASQVFKLGIVPWDQGLTGVGPFNYPAGFAVLNAVWMTFSGFSAVEIVTVQPMLQFLLAVVLCAAVGPLIVGRAVILRSVDNLSLTLVSLLCILLYWFLLPYGLQVERFHGEGTARLSCSLLSAIPLLLWIAHSADSSSLRSYAARFFLASVSLVLIATINPLSALLPAIFVSVMGIGYVWRGIRARELYHVGCIGLITGMTAAILIGGEPYFITRIAGLLGSSSDVSSQSLARPDAYSTLSMTLSTAQVLEFLLPSRLVSYVLAGTYSENKLLPFLYWALGLSYSVWMYLAPRPAIRGILALISFSMVACAFSGLSAVGSVDLPLYLIQPYVVQTVFQCGALLGFILLIPLGLLFFSVQGVAQTAIVSLLTICCFLFPSAPITTQTGAFNMNVRGGYCQTMACLSDADRAALDFIEKLGTQIRAKYPHLSYDEAPKILILGIPAILGAEKWVFPSGSARVVPLFSKLPVAFFYGRGHQDWDFDNYQQRVCKKLDVDWLKKRNVRYLFLAKKDPGCMKRRREMVGQGKILFDAGGARVVQLF